MEKTGAELSLKIYYQLKTKLIICQVSILNTNLLKLLSSFV